MSSEQNEHGGERCRGGEPKNRKEVTLERRQKKEEYDWILPRHAKPTTNTRWLWTLAHTNMGFLVRFHDSVGMNRLFRAERREGTESREGEMQKRQEADGAGRG